MRDASVEAKTGVSYTPVVQTIDQMEAADAVEIQVFDVRVYQNGAYAIAALRLMDTGECWLYAFGPEAGVFTTVPGPGQVLETARAYYEYGIGAIGTQRPSQWLRSLLMQPTETGTVGVPVASCAIPAEAPVLFGQEVTTSGDPGAETAQPTVQDTETDSKTPLMWAAAAAAGLFLLNKGL